MKQTHRNEVDDAALRQMENELAADLANLRLAATTLADRAAARSSLLPHRAETRPAWLTWGATVTAAALLLAGGLRLSHHPAPDVRGMGVSQASSGSQEGSPAMSDEALLEQIQGDLSRGEPAAMRPLSTGSDSQRSQVVAKQRSE